MLHISARIFLIGTKFVFFQTHSRLAVVSVYALLLGSFLRVFALPIELSSLSLSFAYAGTSALYVRVAKFRF
jgi:hypothetical protein